MRNQLPQTRRRAWLPGLLLSMVLAPALSVQAAALVLESDSELASAGFYTLSWPQAAGAEVELEQAGVADFTDARVIYRGRDLGRVISGQVDGRYHYRLRRVAGGDWSTPVTVRVRHHPLSRALAFFGLGALVFLATLVLIVRGGRHHD